MVEGRFLEITGVGLVTQGSRLSSVAFVATKDFETEFFRLFVEGVGQLLIVHAKSITGSTRIRVAIPFPRIDAIQLDLAFYLFLEHREVGLVFGLVPIVIGGAVVLVESPRATGYLIELSLCLSH